MNTILMGALAGLGLAVLLFVFDYMAIKRGAAERAVRQHKKVVELDSTERARITSLLRFCIFLPPVGALLFWIFA